MIFEPAAVERKSLAILRILSDSPQPVGARVIAHRLQEHGFELGERAVRYHLKLLDERGLTFLVGKRDGRVLTDKGMAELKSALVKDKVGFVISKIETLSFRTTFDVVKRDGLVPVNVSLFPVETFETALKAMRPAFEAGLCTSQLVAVASEGGQLGDISVPKGKMGLATVCSIIFNGCLLKAGVPMDSRFGGILQLRDRQALRFTELIDYTGCSLDPSTIYIKARMTSVRNACNDGNGELLANFREIPSICRPISKGVIDDLEKAGFHGIIAMGETSEPVCEMTVGLNKVGIAMFGGLNPVAAAEEAGISAENHAMSTVMEYRELIGFRDAVIEYRDLVKFRKASV
jgi:repressor of nif and glnA expression